MTSRHELGIERMEEPGTRIEGLSDSQSFWFESGGEILSCWISDQKERSTSWFLASLS